MLTRAVVLIRSGGRWAAVELTDFVVEREIDSRNLPVFSVKGLEVAHFQWDGEGAMPPPAAEIGSGGAS